MTTTDTANVPDVRLELRVRNNVMYRAIFDRWPSVSAFCRETSLHRTMIDKYLNLAESPVTQDGEYSKPAIRIAIALGIHPDELYPERLYTQITATRVALELDSATALPCEALDRLESSLTEPSTVMESRETHDAIHRALDSLTFREREIIKLRYGIDHDGVFTLEECSTIFKISKERVRVIEARAIRKMQKPIRSRAIASAAFG